ncbi:MAG: hypothetical protein AAF441_25275, partial [Pseudomonadota bacterium]
PEVFEILEGLRIPEHPDSRSDNIRTGIPGYPDKPERRCWAEFLMSAIRALVKFPDGAARVAACAP